MLCTWHVRYADGTELYEAMQDSPHAVNGQVGWRHIDWPHVATLTFVSEEAQQAFSVAPAPSGCRYRLFRRVTRSLQTGDDVSVIAVVLEVVTEQWPPNPNDALSTLYWFPDGAVHQCRVVNCPAVTEYLTAKLWGRQATLAATHNA